MKAGTALTVRVLTAPRTAMPLTQQLADEEPHELGRRQYLAIQSGLNRNARNINSVTPELRETRNQTMLFVFGL
jgi:hypothetical protein